MFIWLAGTLLRLLMINFAAFFPEVVVDFTYYRLPIAQCILDEGWLYCDCKYNHTPMYPYISAAMLWLSGGHEFLQVFLINLPLAFGDMLVPVVIFVLFKSLFNDRIAFLSSAWYALNPIAILEVGISHWDGFTLAFFLFGLLSISKEKTFQAGIFAGIGFVLKQFPLGLFPVLLFKTKNIKKTVVMGVGTLAVVALFFSPFLWNCAETFFSNLFGHPLWKGKTSLGIGTMKSLLENLSIPNAKIVGYVIFISLLALPSFFVTKNNYAYYAGILMLTLTFFTFVTHRQLVIWSMPFIILITLNRKAYITFMLLLIGYAIRIIKPEWYFGVVYIGVGVWYYIACFQSMLNMKNCPQNA